MVPDYFPDKHDLVQAVIDYQADAIVKRQVEAPADGVEVWRNMVITVASDQAKGLPMVGSLANSPRVTPRPERSSRAGFDEWAAAITDGLRSLHADGKLPSDIDPEDLATGRCLSRRGPRRVFPLAQVQRVPARSKPRSRPPALATSRRQPKPSSFTATSDVYTPGLVILRLHG